VGAFNAKECAKVGAVPYKDPRIALCRSWSLGSRYRSFPESQRVKNSDRRDTCSSSPSQRIFRIAFQAGNIIDT